MDVQRVQAVVVEEQYPDKLNFVNEALIIFVRHPELGKVKTRLAKDIGDEAALRVYKFLLQHTHDITYHLGCDKFVYYSSETVENDLWENDVYHKRPQQGADLGERMMLAFKELFESGYSRIVIIGSDCPKLTTTIIEEAMKKLIAGFVVLGPATDGGYYLLGLNQLIPNLFQNKAWSTPAVLTETTIELKALNHSYFLLPELTDIDTVDQFMRQIV